MHRVIDDRGCPSGAKLDSPLALLLMKKLLPPCKHHGRRLRSVCLLSRAYRAGCTRENLQPGCTRNFFLACTRRQSQLASLPRTSASLVVPRRWCANGWARVPSLGSLAFVIGACLHIEFCCLSYVELCCHLYVKLQRTVTRPSSTESSTESFGDL
jgi:hypothetical protein